MQLGLVVPKAQVRAPRTGGADAIPLAHPDPVDPAVPPAMGALDQRDALLARAGGVAFVEEADVDPVGMPAIDAHLHAVLDDVHTRGWRRVAAGGAGCAWLTG